jgi:hypothetical protein
MASGHRDGRVVSVIANLPENYSRFGFTEKCTAVIRASREIAFDLDFNRFTDDWLLKAFASFTSATVVQVFVLAQILAENQPLTVRGGMYRGIGTIWQDSSNPNYRKCSRLILQMRRLGLIPYSWIVDGTRRRDKPSSWSGLADYAETVARAYRKDLWERQPGYIEVFVEKDAMSGIIAPITHEYDVTITPIRGFISETTVWETAEEWKLIEKPITVYYLGDHDPSGLKIEADLRNRLAGFCEFNVSWNRIAINDSDFANPNLLGFPVKRKDQPSKWRPYLENFGDRCVEVDAIPAPEIRARVRAAIESHINQGEWEFLKAQEQREKQDVLTMVRSLQGGRL